ncbi:proteophosphoglycan ppg4 [Rhodotorula toruloides]|uniref:Proteophosphoglycan ppg4 n=1 Tax=Rhodotorula toruloides TaxID=5286 RepID=A0A511KSZ3_RHOTO|nr:proteophosphoglycan ppg4 [Rhodotorula toruloides]
MHASSALLDASNHPSLPRPRSAIPGQAAAVVKKALSSDEFVRRTKRGEQELGDDEGGKRRYVSAGEGVGAKKGEDKATETGQAHQQHQQRVPTSRPTSPVAHLHARVPRSSLNVAASRSSNTGTSQAGSSSSGAPSSASSSLTPKPRSRSRLPLVLPPDASHISTPSSTPLPSPSSDTRPRSSLFLSLSLGPIPPCVTPTEVVACGGEAGGRALEAQVQETDLQMQLVGGNHTPAPEKTLPSPLASPRNRVPLALTPTEQDRPESRPQQSRRPSSLAPMSTSRPLSSLQVPESSLPSPALSGSSSTNSFISADYTGLACPVPVRPSRISLAMQKSASAGDCDESKRPPIATFTSFEEAFGLSAPLSPPPSPPPPEPTPPPQQQASKSWWPL